MVAVVTSAARRRTARVTWLSVVLGVLLVLGASSAWAGGFGSNPPGTGGPPASTPPAGGPGDPGGGGQAGGSSGGNAQANAGGCRVFATPSHIGLSCITGGAGDVTTVREILHGDPAPTCWDTVISDADLQDVYGYTEVEGLTYYLHSCITGLDLNRSLHYQPDLNLSQSVIEIPDGAPRCDRPFRADEVGQCVMWLTDHQQTVVDSVDSDDSDIPGVVIVTRPSPKVRTNVDTAFVDSQTITQTQARRIGGVRVWAVLDDQYIEPNGAGEAPKKQCRLTARVSEQDTPQTAPSACWWTYTKSSAAQPGQVYPFRASAHWTVYYADRAGTHVLTEFVKYAQLQLPVYDIQALVTS